MLLNNMKKELSVLRYINSDGNTTQRDIARLTGMSLGNVNAAIKNLIEKGLLLKKANNERVVEYILTSEGKRRKSTALLEEYSLIVESTLAFQQNVIEVIDECCTSKGLHPVLLGYEDGILRYLENILKSVDTQYEIKTVKSLSDFKARENTVTIVWQPDIESALKQKGLTYIHILDRINKSSIK